KATGQEIEEIVLPRLRNAAAQHDDVVDRLAAVLDESKQLMHDYPHLAAFLRAIRVESYARSAPEGPKYPGSKALRDVVSEIVEDAREQGMFSAATDATAAVEAICALTRGLSEQAASLPPEGYEATLRSAKKLIRGTLFAGVNRTSGGQ
ncbi:TetR/AcrR family transcriptional regulator, partial [Mycobacterium simiae]